MVMPRNKIMCLHFTDTALQAEDLWLPVLGDMFHQVELTLIANGIAQNVTSITEIRKCGECIDYDVIYNEATL